MGGGKLIVDPPPPANTRAKAAVPRGFASHALRVPPSTAVGTSHLLALSRRTLSRKPTGAAHAPSTLRKLSAPGRRSGERTAGGGEGGSSGVHFSKDRSHFTPDLMTLHTAWSSNQSQKTIMGPQCSEAEDENPPFGVAVVPFPEPRGPWTAASHV